MYNPYDFYFKQAKKTGYKARSAFKLDEIQEKFHLFDASTKHIIDIGCAPGSRLQYAVSQVQKNTIKHYKIIGFDLKPVDLNMNGLVTYQQDITDKEKVKQLLAEQGITQVDLIQSDMAPNTIGIKDIDAMRSMALIQETLWMYQELLKPNGKFVIKVFMGPGFEEFVGDLKTHFGGKAIKIFKPKASRSQSKETYIIKI